MPPAAPLLKIAVITPFHQTQAAIFRQCAESVRQQTHPCTHLVVADGPPSLSFDSFPNLLLTSLPRASADYGNTPRVIGALLAESYGFDAIALLDDDNWLEPNHLASLVATHHATQAPLIASQRIFRHLDGSKLPITEPAEDAFQHVDANCWLITRPAFPLLAAWRVPKFACFIADRIFFQKAQRERYQIAATCQRTVNYRTKYQIHYRNAGIQAPKGAYEPGKMQTEFSKLTTPDRIAALTEAIGFYPKLI